MGTRKNATYKVHNGVDFDEIMFQTIADQVLITKDGMTLGEFLRNGGAIGGGYLGAFANGLVFGKDGIPDSRVQTLYSGDINMFGPSVTKKVSLGYDTNAWKEAWIGSYSNADNGYTTLPNGFILQWGTIVMGQGFQHATYPLKFPNKTLFCDATVIFNVTLNNNSSVNTAFANAIPSDDSKAQITLHQLAGSTNIFRVLWFAVGY